MIVRSHAPRSTIRLFVVQALVALVPVLLLFAVLAATFRTEANRRGLAEGRSEAVLLARTAVEPSLDGRPLGMGLSPTEKAGFQQLAANAMGRDLLRLRLRNLQGQVVFSGDGSGFGQTPEPAALAATRGNTVVLLTHLNADGDNSGPVGPQAVEVYLPLRAGTPDQRVGVLEVYLPYGPINADVSTGLSSLRNVLTIGLALLYLALLAISWQVGKRLRRQVRLNAFLAEYDPLTELPNRTLFLRQVTHALGAGERQRPGVAVAIVDLDRFKEVNDTLGHHNGDLLLKVIANRLRGAIGPDDFVARLGGDEFGLVIGGSEVEQTLGRLRTLINEEVEIVGLPLSVESSFGFVVAPEDGTDADELLQRADVAMYVAKATHAGVVRYRPEQHGGEPGDLSLMAELRHAIGADELVLHYQPKAAVFDGRIEAVEALVRWQHPTRGLLYPDSFLPLAEQTDLMDLLTPWVLGAALTQIRDMGALGADLTVAVNVSGRNLSRSEFAKQVIAVIEDIGLTPDRLIVEITETALVTDPHRAAAVLIELASAGIRISIDDFGQGQTSLGYLPELPIYELKIDKSFVFDMLDNKAHASIVRSVIDLGHNLSYRVVAEGVETEEILDALRVAGCDVAQGYLLARPMPMDQLGPWLAQATSATTATTVSVN